MTNYTGGLVVPVKDLAVANKILISREVLAKVDFMVRKSITILKVLTTESVIVNGIKCHCARVSVSESLFSSVTKYIYM